LFAAAVVCAGCEILIAAGYGASQATKTDFDAAT
jgi:hypothetical protein